MEIGSTIEVTVCIAGSGRSAGESAVPGPVFGTVGMGAVCDHA